MIKQILFVLSSIALVSARAIETEYSPAASVSYSSISPHLVKTISTPVVEKQAHIGYTKIIQSPPIYQSILTTKENNYESPDGTQHAIYTKSFNTDYSNFNKFDSETPKGDLIANTIPGIYPTAVHSPIVYHPRTSYTVSSPLVHTLQTPALSKSLSHPISYTTHDISKTIVSPTSYISTPIFDKTKYVNSGLSSYSSHAPIIESQPIKTTITYSEAPLVSHMSFTGLGASYSW